MSDQGDQRRKRKALLPTPPGLTELTPTDAPFANFQGLSSSNRPPLIQPPTKQPRLSAMPSAGDLYAGQGAEREFPDSKTILHNALQMHLRRMDARLEYKTSPVYAHHLSSRIFRSFIEVPYPELFTVYGEGTNKKDAEKRASAAACLKLLEFGVIDKDGRSSEKFAEMKEDHKPKLLQVSIEGQIELYDAIACLPECAGFTNWDDLSKYYKSQKQKQAVNSADSLFQLAFNPLAATPGQTLPPGQPQTTTIVLPSSMRRGFPTGQAKPLASLPCPYCLRYISISLAHLGVNLTPSLPNSTPFPTTSSSLPPFPLNSTPATNMPQNTTSTAPTQLFPPSNPPPLPTWNNALLVTPQQSIPDQTLCAFTGRAYVALTDAENAQRGQEMGMQQEEMRRKFAYPTQDSPQFTAQHLPVAGMRDAILTQINTLPVVIVAGMTGSGKTTQVPQFILENYIDHGVGSSCNIIVTQPRRISCITIAQRVAAERGEPIGLNVGYQVRLESCVPQKSGRILYCTTGILLMRLRKNPYLEGVSHVIVDEVHERDINTDFLLILLREIVRSGASVKVILMSASLDSEMFAAYFRACGIPHVPCVNVQGHCYPVVSHFLEEISHMIGWKETPYDEPDTNVELVTHIVAHLAYTQPIGAILVFLPGWDDIMAIQDLLHIRLQMQNHRYQILPLHSMMGTEYQHQVFTVPPVGVRKIILATNIAESSITIDDIVYVVNTGTVKVKSFDPARKISCLQTKWSSKSSITQREGRAGRCQPGHSYHLFTRHQYEILDDYEVPEMQRMPLEELILQAKVLNPWQPVAEFLMKAMNPPHPAYVSAAVSNLRELGALSAEEALTQMGQVLAELPLDPRVGRLVLLGIVFKTLDPILTIAAAMGYKDPFVSPPTKRQEADEAKSRLAAGCYSDHLLLLRAFDEWSRVATDNQDNDFVRKFFLHKGSLKIISGLRNQFKHHLNAMGFHNLDSYNHFSGDTTMIRAVLTAGLYPSTVRVGKRVESGGIRETGVQRKRLRMGFSTFEDGRVFMHPSSVNSEKTFPSNWFVYYEKIKTTRVFIRDSTLIHPLHLLLFAGKTMDTFTEDTDNAVVGLDNQEWFGFEMALNLADLLKCARQAVAMVMEAGVRGQLPESHMTFLEGVNKFLTHNTHFDNSQSD